MAHRALSPRFNLRQPVVALSIAIALGSAATGPAYAQVSVDVDVGVTAQPDWLYDSGAVVSLFIDPPVQEPEPVAVAWAPPPMLVEEVPPQPDPYAVWTGGYWAWQGDWVWCAGRWIDPPRREYVWVQPYYEHRDTRVIFIPGYWSRPDVEFIAPPLERPIAWAYVNAGVVIGPAPEGPVGVFVPPPPGSRPGLIVPAPIGTPPAVVISAPAVTAVGMRVTGAVAIDARRTVNDNRVTNYSVTNVRNVTNVIVEAPGGVTASGRAFQAQVPHQAHLAAAMHPQIAARAPTPVAHTAVAAYVPGRTPAALPAAQKVRGLPAVPSHGVATVSQAQRAEMGHAPLTPAEARQMRTAGHDANPSRLPPSGATPQGARPAQTPTTLQAMPAEPPRAIQEPPQQRAPMQDPQRMQQERAQAQRAEQQREQREQAQRAEQQRAQQEAQARTQQRAQQEQIQRAERERAQQEAQARTQQLAQQRAQQEQAQRAEQQRMQQEQAQRAEQQRAAPEDQRPRAPQGRGEPAHARGEEASRPAR